jgi:hypothetical protein
MIRVPKEARIRQARRKREKGKGNGKKSPGHEKAKFLTTDESGTIVGATWTDTPPNHEPYQKKQKALRSLREEQMQKEAEEKAAQDNDVLDIGVNEDMFVGEKEETSGNRNNNNAKTTTKNQPAKKQPTKKEAKSPDTDRKRTYSFFPSPTKHSRTSK